MSSRPRLTVVDALLVLMAGIWGVNYSVMKRAFVDVPPLAFNGVRFVLASVLFLVAIAVVRRRWIAREPTSLSRIIYTPTALSSRDAWDVVWLGLVGCFLYQTCWALGLARTTASNGALILGATPVVVAMGSAALGHERLGRMHWIGAALSALGLYLVIGRHASFGGRTWRGDALMLAGLACWSVYTIGARRLMSRHSPLFVTAMTTTAGTIPYALLALPEIVRVRWTSLPMIDWALLAYAAILAAGAAYILWYTGVQRLGPARTSIYSNVIPIAAMAAAAVWLHEPMTPVKIAGAACVICGVLVTRVQG
ncbi:MAG TPA: DMT family transporter [Vicinamibacterales bacterium]|nr:DMT family transporter [Vicinamibacterales bacterium]